jgi:hypothetical protein
MKDISKLLSVSVAFVTFMVVLFAFVPQAPEARAACGDTTSFISYDECGPMSDCYSTLIKEDDCSCNRMDVERAWLQSQCSTGGGDDGPPDIHPEQR